MPSYDYMVLIPREQYAQLNSKSSFGGNSNNGGGNVGGTSSVHQEQGAPQVNHIEVGQGGTLVLGEREKLNALPKNTTQASDKRNVENKNNPLSTKTKQDESKNRFLSTKTKQDESKKRPLNTKTNQDEMSRGKPKKPKIKKGDDTKPSAPKGFLHGDDFHIAPTSSNRGPANTAGNKDNTKNKDEYVRNKMARLSGVSPPPTADFVRTNYETHVDNLRRGMEPPVNVAKSIDVEMRDLSETLKPQKKQQKKKEMHQQDVDVEMIELPPSPEPNSDYMMDTRPNDRGRKRLLSLPAPPVLKAIKTSRPLNALTYLSKRPEHIALPISRSPSPPTYMDTRSDGRGRKRKASPPAITWEKHRRLAAPPARKAIKGPPARKAIEAPPARKAIEASPALKALTYLPETPEHIALPISRSPSPPTFMDTRSDGRGRKRILPAITWEKRRLVTPERGRQQQTSLSAYINEKRKEEARRKRLYPIRALAAVAAKTLLPQVGKKRKRKHTLNPPAKRANRRIIEDHELEREWAQIEQEIQRKNRKRKISDLEDEWDEVETEIGGDRRRHRFRNE